MGDIINMRKRRLLKHGQRLFKKKPDGLLSEDQKILLDIIRDQVEKESASYFDDENGRWWYLNAKMIAQRAPVGSYTSDPLLAHWLVQTLNWLRVIELHDGTSIYAQGQDFAFKLTELGETLE